MAIEAGPPETLPEAPAQGASARITGLQVWQSQFPPPDAIERYEAVLPGTFDRLIAMVEQNQRLQFEENQRVQGLIAGETRRGQWLGFIVTLAAMAGAVGAAAARQPAVAAALVSVPVMSVAKAFVEGLRPRK